MKMGKLCSSQQFFFSYYCFENCKFIFEGLFECIRLKLKLEWMGWEEIFANIGNIFKFRTVQTSGEKNRDEIEN